jgi:hypothetical protein
MGKHSEVARAISKDRSGREEFCETNTFIFWDGSLEWENAGLEIKSDLSFKFLKASAKVKITANITAPKKWGHLLHLPKYSQTTLANRGLPYRLGRPSQGPLSPKARCAAVGAKKTREKDRLAVFGPLGKISGKPPDSATPNDNA